MKAKENKRSLRCPVPSLHTVLPDLSSFLLGYERKRRENREERDKNRKAEQTSQKTRGAKGNYQPDRRLHCQYLLARLFGRLPVLCSFSFPFLNPSDNYRKWIHKGGAGIKKREKEQGRRDETTQKTIKKKPMTTSQEFVGFFIVFLVVPVFPSLRRLCLGLSVYFLSNIIDNKRSETRDGRRGKTLASLRLTPYGQQFSFQFSNRLPVLSLFLSSRLVVTFLAIP
tara:strand:+ start:722 stop:1399 length:678 start_codon:yes stop_codon:yes gene_type:complete